MWATLIADAARELREAGVASPEVDARELAEWATGARPDPSASPRPEELTRFRSGLERRRQREPLQHIIGTMWFRYLELVSRPGAFIVRPETEIVADAGIRALREMNLPRPVVVDLCTGSGAIALAIATEVPQAAVYGVELSEQAFAVAKENNARYNDVVRFIHGDARTALPELAGTVDLVISNPPYVPRSHELSPEVLADPDAALYGGGDDGLDVPRELIARSFALLRPGGILVMEHGDDQGAAMRQAARDVVTESGPAFTDITTGHDLSGRDRYLTARRTRDEL